MNAESQGLSPLRILLAEDERSVAFSIAFALKIVATRSRSWPMARRRSPALEWNPTASIY